VIVVTSALPAEGKSQTAISLARAYALAGKKVVLIDADLRRPTLHNVLGLQPESGFADVLASPPNISAVLDLMRADPLSGAWFLPGSPVRYTATAHLLESNRLDTIIADLAKTFDVVVIDSSPVLPVVDARLLLRFASAVVLVVRWAHTSQRDVRSALSDLTRHNRNGAVIVSVLNRVEKMSVGYGYGRYYAPYNLDEDR
jgi:capsular exopolysaccharide synthesis family protein